MISAIAFVLFVRDKYTIRTLSERIAASAFGSESFSCGKQQSEIKQKSSVSTFKIKLV
jgi:hypothetical protein